MRKLSEKIIFFITILIIGYFVFITVNQYIIKSNNFWLGFIRELITIPLLIFQIFLFLITIIQCIINKFKIKTYSFLTFIILLISIIFITIPFFWTLYRNLNELGLDVFGR